jgi:peptidoglycan/LPS O-acetylase OafA/YrhL
VAAVVACVALLARAVLGLFYPLGFGILGTDTEADQLMFGCALAVLAARHPLTTKSLVRRWAWPALVVMALMLSPLIGPNFPSRLIYVRDTAGLVVFGVSSAIVLGYLNFADPHTVAARIMSFAPIVLLGRISYGLYLWHMPVFELVRRVLHSRSVGPGEVFLEFAVSLAVAALSFVLLERPLLRLKDRLKPTGRLPRAGAVVSEARA